MYVTQNVRPSVGMTTGRLGLVYLFAIVLATGMIALIVGATTLGVLVQHRVVALPEVDTQIAGFHIKAFTTNDSACADYLLCPPDHIATSEEDFYTIWVLWHTDQPNPSEWFEIGQRLLVIPLKQRV